MFRRTLMAAAILVLVLPAPAALAGGGGCVEITEGSSTTVELVDACITPTLVRVDPGATVTFVNRDEFRHVIAGAGYGWGSDGFMRADEAFSARFRSDGVYPFQCYLHPGMTGAVIVGEATGLGPAGGENVLVAPAENSPGAASEEISLTKAATTGSSVAGAAWTAGIIGLGLGIGVGASSVVAWGTLRGRTREVKG